MKKFYSIISLLLLAVEFENASAFVILPDATRNEFLQEIPDTYTLVAASAFGCADTINVLFDPVALKSIRNPLSYCIPIQQMLFYMAYLVKMRLVVKCKFCHLTDNK